MRSDDDDADFRLQSMQLRMQIMCFPHAKTIMLDSAHANLGMFVLFCTAHIAPHVPSQSAQRTSDGYGHVLGVCLPLVGKRCVMQLFHTHHVVMITWPLVSWGHESN